MFASPAADLGAPFCAAGGRVSGRVTLDTCLRAFFAGQQAL